MSQLKLPKALDEDIKLISDLEYVEIKKWDDSLYENDVPFDDDSHGIEFEDSSQESEDLCHNFEVSIHIKECVYAISKNTECVVTLRIELREDLNHPLVEVCRITNSSIQLRTNCEYYFNQVAFSRSSNTGFSMYKLIIDFYNFLQMDPRGGEFQQISEGSSIFEDAAGAQISMGSDPKGSKKFFQYFSNNTYNDHLKKVSGYNGLYRNTTRYNSMEINRKDKIYTHLTTHSRYFREFKEEAILGSGSFGCVTKVLRNGINYAVKQIPIYENYESILHEEAAVLASLHHPNIVRYYDAWLEQSPDYLINKFNVQAVDVTDEEHERRVGGFQTPSTLNYEDTYEANGGNTGTNSIADSEVDRKIDQVYKREKDNHIVKFYNKHYRRKKENMPKKCLFILMEYCGEESLLETINTHTLHETPQKVIELFRQVMEALSYIHEKGIIHRDVKPSNIFLKFENEFLVKLGDFGLTAKLQQSKGDKGVKSENGLVGTLHYMAPEQLEGDAYDEKVDIFSSGVVLFEMLSKPFHTFMERCEVLSSFSTPDKQWPEGFRERVDHRLFKLLEAMLNVNPKKRPSASEILQNEVFSLNRLNLQSLYDVVTRYPQSMESVQLLNTIFSRKQQYKKLSDCYNIASGSNVVDYVNSELKMIYDKEFRSRNVLRVQPPLLMNMPLVKGGTEEKYVEKGDNMSREKLREASKEAEGMRDGVVDRNRILLNDGRCCYLRYSVLYSMAECMPTDLSIIMRRHAYVPVYSVSPVGGGLGSSGVMTSLGSGATGRVEGRWEGKADSRSDGRGEARSFYYYLGYDILVDYLVLLSENQEYEMDLDAFFTYELVAVSSRPLKRFINCTLVLEWSHHELITKLMGFLKVPEGEAARVGAMLASESTVKGKVPGLSDEVGSLLASLHQYLHKFKGKIPEFKRGLEAALSMSLEGELLSYLKELNYFERFLADFDGAHYFRPIYAAVTGSKTGCGGMGSGSYTGSGFTNGYSGNGAFSGSGGGGYTRSGSTAYNYGSNTTCGDIFEKYAFKMSLEVGKRSFGEFVYGGCYNRIVESVVTKRHAFGFEMNLQPIYEYFTQNTAQNANLNPTMRFNLNYAPDVIIYTPQVNLMVTATSLENRFWKLGLKCYRKATGAVNTKKIARMKKLGLFSLQKLKYLITIKRTTEAHEVQYVLVDIDLENKEVSRCALHHV
ncbi:serine/threonine protein kinase [Theileria orientalis strain Shintoku]|uniref:Serine/threonine protein kinase n=1 Tax=Theileria orientalis strain Shintoku TaxID=869250 RepID=J4CD23_THEOR|nr:serine/threonine protein kinase [Theileria orientalis strain Shintoku]BAM40392.1 serine/threonine protein kinase [Theileria orientalis strain Shintoku]|eukprot:XP_009690693.1 serine/threonine protein kinase [Theileria orientalis strain Shintoku]